MGMREETIRFVVEASSDGIKTITKDLDAVTAAAAAGEPKARAFVDELEKLGTVGSSVKGFAALKASLQETGDNLFLARRRLDELQKEFDETLEPTKKMTKELDRARAEVARLAVEQNRQTAALQRSENIIKGAGYNLNQLARAEADVRAKTVQSTAAMRAYAKDLQQVGSQASRTAGLLNGLRGIAAGVFAGVSARGAAEGVKSILELGDAAERTRTQFTSLYGGIREGDAALTGLKKLAGDLGVSWDDTRTAAVKLKAFGIDPLNGTLRALINENAKMGGSQERLEGTILAVGQAWAKQKLQGEEILQLVERGVPVWDILQKVTGKNVTELQKLSEAGKLGRKEISALIAEIDRMNSGAAAKNAGTLSGLFTQLTSKVRDFFTTVSNSGALDYFKGQLDSLIKRIDEMAKSGELADLAKKISDGIVGTAEAIRGVIGFVAQYGEQIMALVRAFVVLKAASFIGGIAQGWTQGFGAAAKGAAGATSMAQKFGASLRNLGKGPIAFAAIAAAVDFTAGQIEELIAVTQEYFSVQEKLKEQQVELKEQQAALAKQAQAVATAYHDASRVQIASQEELSKKSAQQLQSYTKQIGDAYKETKALAILARDAGNQTLFSRLSKEAEAFNKALIAAKAQFALVGDALGATAGDFAKQAVNNFDALIAKSRTAVEAVRGVFDKLDLATPKGVTDLVETVSLIAPRAKGARAALEGELLVALEKLNGEQLRNFQFDVVKAFAAAEVGARDAALIMDTVLKTALDRLGVSAADAGVKFTAAGKDILATFQTVLESAQATGPQIAAAFNAALAKITTKEEAEALGEAIKKAGEQGKIGLDAAKDAAAALGLRLREIAQQADPLADDFERLGIKSKAQLDLARDAAKRAFDAIVDGARKGKAAQEDVRAAFVAYAQAALQAAENSSAAARYDVEQKLKLLATSLNVRDALEEVGLAGKKAGANVAAGANQATEALDETADAADNAADATDGLGDSADGAADGLRRIADEGNNATAAAFEASAAFADAASMAGKLDRITFGLLQEQQIRFQQELDATNAVNDALDERKQLVSELTSTYNLLGEAQIQQLANAKLEQRQAEERRREQELRRQEDEQRARDDRSSSESSAGGGGGGGAPQQHVFELKVSGGTLPKDRESLRQLARDLAPEMVRLGMRGVKFTLH
jgi:tape measure domain-containing protein